MGTLNQFGRAPVMGKCGLLCLAALAAFWGAAGARAADVYSTGFENPPFSPGSQLLGQDGWSTAIPPFLNPAAATIQSDLPASGTQYVRVLGSALQGADEVRPQYDAVGSYRRPVDYNTAATGLQRVRLQADVRLDGPLVGTGDLFSANLAARSGDGTAGEIGISSDGQVYAYAPGTGIDTPPVASRQISLGQYHTLGIDLDFAGNTVSYSVDGTPLGGSIPFDATFTSDVLSRGALVSYARADTATAQRANYTFRYDNFSITAVPEPAAATVLLGLGSLLLGRRRRS